jgi:phage shock protein PspC (stress-responsive transcriptional regulator)
VDEENEIIEAARSKRENLLNNGILWLGVLSVAGTVAGVIQFFDFDNEALNHASRVIAIVVTTLIAVLAFLYIQCGRKLRRLIKRPKKSLKHSQNTPQ